MLPAEAAAATVFECPDGFEEVDEDVICYIPNNHNSCEVKVMVSMPNDTDGQHQLLTLDVSTSGDQMHHIGGWTDSSAQLKQKSQRVQSSAKNMRFSKDTDSDDTQPNDIKSNKIYLDESMRIINPRVTLIKRTSKEGLISVVTAPEVGDQKLYLFNLPKNVECTVDAILDLLQTKVEEEIAGIYLTPNCNVDYVIRLFTKPSCREVESFNNSSKKNCFMTIDLAKDETNSETSLFGQRIKENEIKRDKLIHMQRLTLHLRRNIQIILSYPLSPRRGSITITTDDFKCLYKNQYLNDVIVDFYLKYLTLETLSPEDQKRIYLFNTYFYTRLSKPIGKRINRELLPAMQHSLVNRWTKNINIFEKDFVIIPVHQNAHWFLVVICYPKLIGTAITRNYSSFPNQWQYPCILVFDSLPTLLSIKRSVIVQDLKNYLRYEYIEKKGPNAVFAEDEIVIFYPDVPYQVNSTDCGLYLLQYMESFCKDFIVPNKLSFDFMALRNWFDKDLIKGKREALKHLIIKLAVSSAAK